MITHSSLIEAQKNFLVIRGKESVTNVNIVMCEVVLVIIQCRYLNPTVKHPTLAKVIILGGNERGVVSM